MIFVLIGKSNAGKTVLANHLMNEFGLKKVITTTSRPPRVGEIDGVDYNFLEYKKMKEDITKGEYVEYAEFNGWLYGTRFNDINTIENCLIVLNPKGYKSLKHIYGKDVIGIYLNPPLLTRIFRILKRDKGNYREAFRRFFADIKDFRNIKNVVEIKSIYDIT